jgi:LMBR1 domain-containing protein 1
MDKANYKMYKRQERLLSMHENGQHNSNFEQSKLWRQISQFLQFVNINRVDIGKVCLAFSCLVVYSLFISNLDRFLHSECGFACGYLLETPQFFNPLDYILRRLSSKHDYIINMEMFLDILVFLFITIYCLICIYFSIVKIGINFFSVEIYRVRRRETLPQALSITSVLVILMMFAYTMQIMNTAPLYTMFGDQRVDKEKMEKCTLSNARLLHDAGNEDEKEEQKESTWGLELESGFGCQMTMISQLYHKMELGLPIFAFLVFLIHWAFIASFVLFLAYHAHYKQTYLQQN